MALSEETTVYIDKLPINIQRQLPYSIRSFKNEYSLGELDPRIRKIIEPYISPEQSIEYDTIYDAKALISEVGDLTTITNVQDTVVEYLKNYFLISKSEYPFDCLFYSRLKYYLHNKNTTITQQLINAEAINISNILTADLSREVKIKDITLEKSELGPSATYYIIIKFTIDGKAGTVSFNYNSADGVI